MATLAELRGVFANDALRNKVESATLIAATDLLSGTPTLNDQKWAADVLSNPKSESHKAFLFVVGINNTASISQIENASDTEIQNNVNAVVPDLVIAFNV